MSNHQKYVVGFMFSPELRSVALIRKVKPEWQKGKMNGIGGKIEMAESSIAAMVREFEEEAGIKTVAEQWTRFLEMKGTNDDGCSFAVYFFHCIGAIYDLVSVEEEKVEIVAVAEISPFRPDIVENLSWLIGLAIDNATDGRPSFATVIY